MQSRHTTHHYFPQALHFVLTFPISPFFPVLLCSLTTSLWITVKITLQSIPLRFRSRQARQSSPQSRFPLHLSPEPTTHKSSRLPHALRPHCYVGSFCKACFPFDKLSQPSPSIHIWQSPFLICKLLPAKTPTRRSYQFCNSRTRSCALRQEYQAMKTAWRNKSGHL